MASEDSTDMREGTHSDKDDRMMCKYGAKCYQKNPAHHEKYKHPPNKRSSTEKNEESPKKPKQTDKSGECDEHTISTSSESPKTQSEHDPSDNVSTEEERIHSLSEDPKEAIKEAFLFEMPEDFYSFWSFCKSVRKDQPASALKEADLVLVGPFDIMSGALSKTKDCKPSDYLRHWRYYYDPPEFQTVIKGDDKELFHIGYYRDDPKEFPSFVASNCAAVDGTITQMGENLFAAVNSYMSTLKAKANPFRKMKIDSLQKSLQNWANKNTFTLETKTSGMKSRDRKVVAKTFHKAGIVVPVDKHTDVGYRPLIEKEAKIKELLKNYAGCENDSQRTGLMEKLQPIITAANIANDECDFGTSLELGLDLFTFGGDMFHTMARHLLCTAYSLLQRNEFAEILKAHLENRKKGSKLSIVDN